MRKTATLQWYQTKQMLVMWGVVSWLLSYFVASRALDTGSLIEYSIAIILVIVGFRLLISAARRLKHDN